MQAHFFYEVSSQYAIPLFLVSAKDNEKQWSTIEKNYLDYAQFKGKLGDRCLIFNSDGLIEKVFIGSGENQQDQALAHAALVLPEGTYELQEHQLTREAALAWGLAQYHFGNYKPKELKSRRLVIKESQLSEITALVQAIYWVRDLINTPPNDMSPVELAQATEQLAKTFDAEFKQWVGEELITHNFPAIHAVGRASHYAPRLLSLTWGEKHHPRVALVGKGVCFDSGGLDIKNASSMRLMKKDMGGAAHVLGLALWIMTSKLPIHLQVLIPAVENAVGPQAFRPSDILTMRNGLKVEVDNTDAEGRLILADALVKACEEQPELIIDFATLTGAARVALGPEIAALFCNKDSLAAELVEISNQISDPIWRLPLYSPYEDYLKSSIADLTNCSESPYGGAITAGLFLQHFVKSCPWVHFDVMAWNLNSKPGKPGGGEALGFRTIADYLLKTYSKKNTAIGE